MNFNITRFFILPHYNDATSNWTILSATKTIGKNKTKQCMMLKPRSSRPQPPCACIPYPWPPWPQI